MDAGSPERAWRQQDASAFPQLLEAVAEFLQFHGLSKAAAALHEERLGSPDLRRPLAGTEGASRIKADLLRYFDQGRNDFFFAAFKQYVAASAEEAQKMEFRLNIYFAVFPVLPASSVLVARGGLGGTMPSARQELATRMQALKVYLEAEGAGLAHSGDFLHYYALPHVSHPERHPTFEHLFQEQWAAGLRADLKRYIDTIPVMNKVPRLYTWYSAAAESEASPPMSRQGSPQRSERASRESLSSFIQPNGRTPRASDAVGDRGPSITPSPRGTTLPPIRGSHSELTRSQTRASDPGICLPPLRPPPSKSRIPAPPVPQPGVVPQYPRPRHARPHSQLLPSPRVSAEGGRWTVDEEPSSRTARGRIKGDGASLQDSQRVAMLAALDYQEILYVVVKGAKEGGSSASLAARLLQALRWRVVRSNAGNDRWEVLATWIQVDLVGVYQYDGQTTQELLKAGVDGSLPLAIEVARLANSIASDRLGRAYLMQSSKTIPTLVTLLKRGANGSTAADVGASQESAPLQGVAPNTEEDALLQQCLVTLHKLSLKRQGQSQMLKQGLLQWLVGLLQNAVLSEATIEYGFALLMNLCLRSAGKAASQQVAAPLVHLCERYLDSKNPQIRTYVHGILYSAAQRPAVRREAQQQGLPAKLKALQLTSQEPFAGQIRYVLKQLDGPPRQSRVGDESEDAAGEDAADAYYDDEDAFAELKKAPEVLVVEPGDLQGEPLLCSAYLAGAREAREQAQLLQSMSMDAPPLKASSLAVSMRSTRRARDMPQSGSRVSGVAAAAAAAAAAVPAMAASWDEQPVRAAPARQDTELSAGSPGMTARSAMFGADLPAAAAAAAAAVTAAHGLAGRGIGSKPELSVEMSADSATFNNNDMSIDFAGASAAFDEPPQRLDADHGRPLQDTAGSAMFKQEQPALGMTAGSAMFGQQPSQLQLTAGSAMFKQEPSNLAMTAGSAMFGQQPSQLQLTAGSAMFKQEPSNVALTAGSAMFGQEPSQLQQTAGSQEPPEPAEDVDAALQTADETAMLAATGFDGGAPLQATTSTAMLRQEPSNLAMTARSAAFKQEQSLHMTAGSAVLAEATPPEAAQDNMLQSSGEYSDDFEPSATLSEAATLRAQADLERRLMQGSESGSEDYQQDAEQSMAGLQEGGDGLQDELNAEAAEQEVEQQDEEQEVGQQDEEQEAQPVEQALPAALESVAAWPFANQGELTEADLMTEEQRQMLQAQADLEARLLNGSPSVTDIDPQSRRGSIAGSDMQQAGAEPDGDGLYPAAVSHEPSDAHEGQLDGEDVQLAAHGYGAEEDIEHLQELYAAKMEEDEEQAYADLLQEMQREEQQGEQELEEQQEQAALDQLGGHDEDNQPQLHAALLQHEEQDEDQQQVQQLDRSEGANLRGGADSEDNQDEKQDEDEQLLQAAFDQHQERDGSDEQQVGQEEDQPLHLLPATDNQLDKQYEDGDQHLQALFNQHQNSHEFDANERQQPDGGHELQGQESDEAARAFGMSQRLSRPGSFQAGGMPQEGYEAAADTQQQSRPASTLSAAPRPASGMSQRLSRPESFQAGGMPQENYEVAADTQQQSRPASTLSAAPRPASGMSQRLSRPESFQAGGMPQEGYEAAAEMQQQSRPASTLSAAPRPASGGSQRLSRPESIQAGGMPQEGYEAAADTQQQSRPASTLSAAPRPASGMSQRLSRPESFQAGGMPQENYEVAADTQQQSRPASTLSAAPPPASGMSQRLSRPESIQAGGMPQEGYEAAAEMQQQSRPASTLSAAPRPASGGSQRLSRPESFQAGGMPQEGYEAAADTQQQSRPASTLSAAPRPASGGSQRLSRPESFQAGGMPQEGYEAAAEMQQQSRPASTLSAAPRPASGGSQRLSRPESIQAGGMPQEGYEAAADTQQQSRPASTLSAAPRPASGMSQRLSRPESFQAGGMPQESYEVAADTQQQSRPASTLSAAPRPASGMSQRLSRPDSFQAGGMPQEGYEAAAEMQQQSRPASTLSAAPRPASGGSQRLSRPESFQAGGMPQEGYEVAADTQQQSRPASTLSAAPRPASGMSQRLSRPDSFQAGGMPQEGYEAAADTQQQSRPASTLSAARRPASGMSQRLSRPDSLQAGGMPQEGYEAAADTQQQSRPASTLSAAPRPSSGMSQSPAWAS